MLLWDKEERTIANIMGGRASNRQQYQKKKRASRRKTEAGSSMFS